MSKFFYKLSGSIGGMIIDDDYFVNCLALSQPSKVSFDVLFFVFSEKE